ncbi:MAG: DNA double-strand break repair protein Mre11 [Candidatus Methanofastidiosum methylothiophilum]|uniref:DNA double-strand break repair protein Mre11 n=1 Tax=Candidatus Methanofastidiosum methylothiophilum TaxID=1705564 RepID=A0A150IN04_9EURY|nr:MAG: DNA double-strand break repair protein Mre11 [Candidatus Methanofastidiosum methylthiophilus]KYC48113.1 MAG: DNA double-strand break repair protein Mre11 [Candidatus Methanofastidiosum methylthiophilus]KYC50648.1 MAG: DNA double-strand break repair protein Mre11 [Candidatus Methanofastidiosum methylthiophilus]
MADLHLGGWREDTLREIGIKTFEKAIDISIQENVDFILISGDLFDSSNPTIDVMAKAAKKLYELKVKGISVYVIEGSHDFSPTGRTILKVFEEAGLLKRVTSAEESEGRLLLKGTTDEKTKIRLYGISGIRGSLEKATYSVLDREDLEQKEGQKIFLFHSAIEELRPNNLYQMQSMPISLLPKGFMYYAGGHIHERGEFELGDYKNVVFPGALFPNNIDELLSFKGGGFYLVEDDGSGLKKSYIPIKIAPVIILEIDLEGTHTINVEEKIRLATDKKDLKNSIVIVKFKGNIEGNLSDINFKKINLYLENKGAVLVKRDTREIKTKQYKEIKNSSFTKEKLEEEVIIRHKDQIKIKECQIETVSFVKTFMNLLSREKKEGEKKDDYIKDILRESIDYLSKNNLLEDLNETTST